MAVHAASAAKKGFTSVETNRIVLDVTSRRKGTRFKHHCPVVFSSKMAYNLVSWRSTMAAITSTQTAGLTTSEAPFIEQARASGDLFIRQPYELYS
jgi:hypothetical protein